MSLFRKEKKANSEIPPLVLRRARMWSPEGVRDGDLHLRDGRIVSIDSNTPADGAVEIDLDGLLVAPGLCDADHALDEDWQAPIFPGPYLDRERRQAEIAGAGEQPGKKLNSGETEARICSAAVALLKEGITCAASRSYAAGLSFPIRVPAAVWLSSFVVEKNPARKFAKAGALPVFAPLADGDSRDNARETARFSELDMLGENLIAVGGVGLRPRDAAALANAGASLVWRPITDEYILGRTIGPDILRQKRLRVLIGAGSRRDGGQGLLAALRRADRLGYLDRARLLRAVTADAGAAFRLPIGVVEVGALADLSVWRANDLAGAVFERGRAALEMTIVGGRLVLCRSAWAEKPGLMPDFRPIPGDEDYLAAADLQCFT